MTRNNANRFSPSHDGRVDPRRALNPAKHTLLGQKLRSAILSERGNAMVELAVAIPILLLLAMGVADYARIYYTGITVANAAEAGAHYGVARGGNVDSMTMAAQLDAGSLTLDSVTAGQTCRCPGTGVVSCASGNCLPSTYGVPQIYDSVRVRKDVALLIRYLGLPSSVTVTRTAILREK